MENTIQTTYTDSEFRALIREELRTVLAENGPVNSTVMETEEFINTQQAADLLKIKKQTIYNLINENKIPYHKKGGNNSRVLFKRSELIDWLKDQK